MTSHRRATLARIVDEHAAMSSLRHEARARGVAWARSIAERRPELRARPFPANVGRTRQLARAKVIDLHPDPIVLDQLEGELYEAAASTWLLDCVDDGG